MTGRRRTITFREDIYLIIQRERGTILIEERIDLNFTEAVNYMLEELLERRIINPMRVQLNGIGE